MFILAENYNMAHNKEVIADALKTFPNWDRLVAKAKAAGAFQDPNEEEEE